jgi:predicted peptidase
MRLFFFSTLTFLLLIVIAPANAQQTRRTFTQETNYLLALPEGYLQDTARRWPLVLFLHGSGEAGYDVDKVRSHGPPKMVDQGRKFPFILVSPQADPAFGWETETLYHLLLTLRQKLRVDNARIYITGLSMGGYGAWKMAMKYPELFAAVVPVCGGGNTDDLSRLRNTPVWVFHGAKDNVVPLSESQKMVNALKKFNSNVKFTIYPDASHDSWTATYENDSLYKWMLSQHLQGVK